jgi:hypothetical protein
MVSFGVSGGSESQSSSKTKFPKKFLEQAYQYFGGEPDYKPKYVGFGSPEDLDKLEASTFGSQQSKLTDAYNSAVARQREELSQSGLLNSPAQYIEGGARSELDKGYLANIQQAARDAALGRLGVQQTEAGRETGFNVDTATKLYNAFLQKLGLAATAGREQQMTAEGGGGFNLGIFSSGSSK